MQDLRCPPGRLHGILTEPGVVEFKCDHPDCGAERGVVVLHRFDAFTGELLQTERFADPRVRKEKALDGIEHHTAAVRSA